MTSYRYDNCPHCGGKLTNENIMGLSNGSSIYAWRCQGCGHEWARHSFIRGGHKLNDLNVGLAIDKDSLEMSALASIVEEQNEQD